jgi:thiamine-phosphate pyrophosphorylase
MSRPPALPAGLYVITERVPALDRDHAAVALAALAGGATVIQLRDKALDGRELLETAQELRRLTRETGRLLIINDRIDLALAVEADGVHLGQSDLPVALARRLLGPSALIGCSVRTVEEARAAEEAGADHLGVGPVFSTATKLDAGVPIGLEAIRALRAATSLPLVAIGGINAGNVAAVMAAGACSAAVISAVSQATDMTEAALRLAEEIARVGAAGA